MLKRAEKEVIIKDLAERLGKKKIAVVSDFHGVSVKKIQALRRDLKKAGAEFKVAKKTLFDRALAGAGIALKTKELKGEVGIAFGYEDEVAPAKALATFAKKNETFKLLAGILGARILTDKEVVAIAKLPPKEVLIAQLLGTLQSPLRGLVTVLGGNMRNLVVVLNKIKEQK